MSCVVVWCGVGECGAVWCLLHVVACPYDGLSHDLLHSGRHFDRVRRLVPTERELRELLLREAGEKISYIESIR